MAKTTINNGDTGLAVRTALNNMFTELYTGQANQNYNLGSGSPTTLLTGVSNTSFGFYAMNAATSAYDCSAFGCNTLQSLTSGYYDTAFGQGALRNATTAFECSAFGVDCLNATTIGRGNSGFGIDAGQNLTGANGMNSCFGWYALQQATTPGNCSVFGAGAGRDVTTGDLNTFVGYQAGRGITTGRANSVFGPAIGLAAALSNNVILADGDGVIRLQSDSTGAITLNSTIANKTITGALAIGAYSYGTLPYTATGNFASYNLGIDSYTQIVVSNSNATATASANVIVSNNLGTDLAYYGAFGINSSGFSAAGVLNVANSTYLCSISGDLAIGTMDAHAVRFGANNWTVDAITISSANVPSLFNANLLSAPAANGQAFQIQSLTELTTIAAAATTTTAIQLPANAIILSVSVRVVTVIPTATTFTVGDSGSAARYNTAAVAVAAGTTDKGTKAGAYYNASALGVLITPSATPATATGQVRVNIHYMSVTPPTS